MMKNFHELSHFSTYNNVSEFDITNDNQLDDTDLKRNLMRKLSFRDTFGDSAADGGESYDPFADVFDFPKRKMTNEYPLNDQMSTQPHSTLGSEPSPDHETNFSDLYSHPPRMQLITPPKRSFDPDLFSEPQSLAKTADDSDKMDEEIQEVPIPSELTRETSLMDRLNTFEVNLPCKDAPISFKPKLRLKMDFNGHFKHTDSPNSCLVRNYSEKSNLSFGSPEKRYNNSSLNTCKNLRDPDLRTITPETLIELIENPQGKKFLVIDCRYPYEYQGGHVKGAININTPDDLEELLIKNRHLLCKDDTLEQIKRDWKSTLLRARLRPHEESPPEEVPPILVFHCEFSQKRGPRALRRLRSLDRNMNYSNWPNLYYPEVYVLENGYKNFHTKFPNHCNPENQYIRMVDKTYKPHYVEAKAHERKVWKKREPSKDDSPGLVPLHRFKTMSCI